MLIPEDGPAVGNGSDEYIYKNIILIRHAQSVWNAVLDIGKDEMAVEQQKEKEEEKKMQEKKEKKESKSLFGKMLDKGIKVAKKAGEAASHSEAFLRKNDHALSPHGVDQCFQLRETIEKTIQLPGQGGPNPPNPDAEWLRAVGLWMVSPFLRALETSAFSLVPIYEMNPDVRVRVIPLCREVYKRRESRDCVGKDKNWGPRMLARAISSIGKAYECRTFEADSLWRTIDLFKKYDIEACGKKWWSDNVENDIDVRNRIDMCMAKVFSQQVETIGIVGHSIFFRRVLQLYWPRDAARAKYLQGALSANFEVNQARPVGFNPPAISPSRYCPDALEVLKVQNCCVLRLCVKYKLLTVNGTKKIDGSSIEIHDGGFLFGTGWEQHSLYEDGSSQRSSTPPTSQAKTSHGTGRGSTDAVAPQLVDYSNMTSTSTPPYTPQQGQATTTMDDNNLLGLSPRNAAPAGYPAAPPPPPTTENNKPFDANNIPDFL